jgi:hypothetical protein
MVLQRIAARASWLEANLADRVAARLLGELYYAIKLAGQLAPLV